MPAVLASTDVSLPARELLDLALGGLEECATPAEATYVIRSLHELAVDEKQLAQVLATLIKPRLPPKKRAQEVRASA